MNSDWVLDVLSDLRTFAEKNGLSRLAAEFDLTRRRAALELAALDAPSCKPATQVMSRSGTALDS